jgi:hypothetical protein
MPPETVPSETNLPSLSVIPPTQPRFITFAWECDPIPGPENYVTGIAASPDLEHWTKVAVLPYATSNTFTIIPGTGMMFFRAFNDFKSP